MAKGMTKIRRIYIGNGNSPPGRACPDFTSGDRGGLYILYNYKKFF